MTTRTSWIAVPEAHPIMNATPLIDVLLVLLIMFIISVPIMTHTVRLDMPGIGDAPAMPIVRVEIEYGGVVVVNHRVLDAGQLERYFKSLSTLSSQPLVRIYTNERATYERFAQVMAMAQR
ncbi:MAG: biopolymer transporter ExbD, partial [Steroidobacteraceae bacterium]